MKCHFIVVFYVPGKNFVVLLPVTLRICDTLFLFQPLRALDCFSLNQLRCSYAGLHCEVIEGYSKGVGYRPGSRVKGREQFRQLGGIAVWVDGSWRFVNCNWGATPRQTTQGKGVEKMGLESLNGGNFSLLLKVFIRSSFDFVYYPT